MNSFHPVAQSRINSFRELDDSCNQSCDKFHSQPNDHNKTGDFMHSDQVLPFFHIKPLILQYMYGSSKTKSNYDTSEDNMGEK